MSDLDKLREKAQAATGNSYRTEKWVRLRPIEFLALIDRLQRVETALRQLINDHLDTCDDTCEAAEIARAALEGGSE